MANTLVTTTMVMKKVGRGFVNNLTYAAGLLRQYDDAFGQTGAKVGNLVKVRLPQRYVVTYGQAYQPQNLNDQTVDIALNQQLQVGFGVTSQQMTLDIDDLTDRYITPAAQLLANAADALAWDQTYKDVYNSVGTPGTTPTTFQTYLNAGVKLDDGAVSSNGRRACLDSQAMASLVNTSTAIFNPAATISENYREGMFGRNQLGVAEWYKDSQRPVHTTGTFTASTPIVSSGGQTGSTINSSGWANGATSLKKGDIITFAGVNSVNPVNNRSNGRLQQFTITADISDTAGAIALPISPAIITSGQLQTVDAGPANNAAIQVWSAATAGGTLATTSAPTGMVYTQDLGAFVMADLVKPEAGAEAQFIKDKEWGINIRWVRQFLVGTDQNASRLDILVGAATIQARFGCRVTG